ncbi:MAG TPA: hypothetical protein VGE83_11445 [Terracidiphilus sp.]
MAEIWATAAGVLPEDEAIVKELKNRVTFRSRRALAEGKAAMSM